MQTQQMETKKTRANVEKLQRKRAAKTEVLQKLAR